MRYLKYFVLLLALMALPSVHSQAQVSFGVQVGPAYGGYAGNYADDAPPVCEWGFYPYYPYACAPYGYYGPQWFANGVFIGAGPWANFYYTHPGFYRPFYFNRGFGRGFVGDRFGGGFRTFRGERAFNGDRFRGSEFRGNNQAFRGGNGFRGFDNRGFRESGRNFNSGRSYNSGRSFNSGRNFNSGRGYSSGRSFGGGFRGESRSYSHGGGSSHGGYSHGGGGHSGRR